MMVRGTKGIGMHKHGCSGRSPKSPRARHNQKLEAERTSVKAAGRIRDPKQSIAELFRGKR